MFQGLYKDKIATYTCFLDKVHQAKTYKVVFSTKKLSVHLSSPVTLD